MERTGGLCGWRRSRCSRRRRQPSTASGGARFSLARAFLLLQVFIIHTHSRARDATSIATALCDLISSQTKQRKARSFSSFRKVLVPARAASFPDRLLPNSTSERSHKTTTRSPNGPSRRNHQQREREIDVKRGPRRASGGGAWRATIARPPRPWCMATATPLALAAASRSCRASTRCRDLQPIADDAKVVAAAAVETV